MEVEAALSMTAGAAHIALGLELAAPSHRSTVGLDGL